MLRFDPTGWNKTYVEEKNNLQYYLKNFKFAINHIGATAIKDGRSNRNVDILITVNSLKELSSIVVRLQSKGYKQIDYQEGHDIATLVTPKKVFGYGVTIRVMLYASDIFNRYNAFYTLLKEHGILIKQYNNFRDEIAKKTHNDYQTYRKMKIDYINQIIDEHYKFE